MTVPHLDQDVHLEVDSVEVAIEKKVVIDIIEIEKGKELGKGNVIAEKEKENANEGKGIEQFVKENVSEKNVDKENVKINHLLEEGNFKYLFSISLSSFMYF